MPRVKILDSKVCYRDSASETAAEEVEETDIPRISIERKRSAIQAAPADFFIDNRDSVTSPRESYGPTCCSFLFARRRT